MEYLPGVEINEAWADLDFRKKKVLAKDLISIHKKLFALKSDWYGSIYRVPVSESASTEISTHWTQMMGSRWKQASLPHNRDAVCHIPRRGCHLDWGYTIGPLNSLQFLDYPDQVPSEFCGPFKTERQLITATAWCGSPPTRPTPGNSTFTYLLQLYDALSPPESADKMSPSSIPTFWHGDPNGGNILIDPETGHVTGLIDWECAGFRRAWAAAEAMYWFDEDHHRFPDLNTRPRGFTRFTDSGVEPESAEDSLWRAYFRRDVHTEAPELYAQIMAGAELRALLRAAQSTEPMYPLVWINLLHEYSWEEHHKERPYPVDLDAADKAYFAEAHIPLSEVRPHLPRQS